MKSLEAEITEALIREISMAPTIQHIYAATAALNNVRRLFEQERLAQMQNVERPNTAAVPQWPPYQPRTQPQRQPQPQPQEPQPPQPLIQGESEDFLDWLETEG